MDSGNSESLQSSSGADDEYDSRATDSSSFLNPIFNPLSQSQPSLMFDPLSNYFDPPIPSSSPHHPHNHPNLHMGWPNKSNPNPTISSVNSQTQLLQTLPFQLKQNVSTSASSSALATSSMVHTQPDQAQTQVKRNPRKRSRASRRALTTVMTTDTANFRAMVQEFTGIPSPPFPSSSPFPRPRLDLFGSLTSTRSNLPPHHNLLRPLPQKPQPLLNTPSNTTSNLSSELGHLNSHRDTGKNLQNNMHMQNPIFTSQFFFQSPNYAPLNASNDTLHLKTGGLDEFGQTYHGPRGVTTNAQLVSSDMSKDGGGGNGYNYSTSNFHGGNKGTLAVDNVSASVSTTTRGEGLNNMESWICSSD